jgi:AraC-like DNA-binding protein
MVAPSARFRSKPALEQAGFAPLRFSTRFLPDRERLPTWRDVFGHGVVRVDVEPLSDVPFRAEARLRALPGLRMIACVSTPVRNRRTAAMAADGDHSIGLFINLGRRAGGSQRGREATLRAGDAMLISHEPSVVMPSPAGHLGVIVPRAALALRVRNLDDSIMRRIPRSTEALRLLRSYLRLLSEKLALHSPPLRETAIGHIYDLIAVGLALDSSPGDQELSAVAAARLDLALDHIAKSFEDPNLTIAAVARRQNISARYLQRLIETTGTSFTTRVNELRLQRALALLTKSGGQDRRISDLAFEVGFSDLSHFNRLFRARFGDTPSGVRRTLKEE